VTILYWGDRLARDIPNQKSVRDTTHVGGAAQLAGFVDSYRTGNPDAFLFVAGGDLAGTVAAYKTDGVAPAKVLGKINPDAYAPGIVDFTYGTEKLKSALKKGKINAISGNVHIDETGPFLPAYDDIRTGNVVVAVTSLLPARLKEMVPRDGVKSVTVADPVATARDFVKDRRDDSDLIVVLSQLGREYDSLLALNVPDIDLIIEGHSRTPFEKTFKVGKTFIVCSGPKGLLLGKLRLEVATDSSSVTLIEHDHIAIESGLIKPSIVVKRAVQELEDRFTRQRGDKVATLLTNWNVENDGPSNLPQWVADMMQQSSGSVKLALVNNLDFEKGFPRGDLYENDLFQIMPFEVPLVAFQIKGYEIRRVVEKQARGELPFLTWSGVNVLIENGKPSQILVRGEGPLQDESEYAGVTNGLLWDRFLKETSLVPDVRPIFIFPILQYQLMLETAGKQKVISTPLDGRWTVR